MGRRKKYSTTKVDMVVQERIITNDRKDMDSAINELSKLGYSPYNDSGVIMVYGEKEDYSKISNALNSINFNGSWGIKFKEV